ncbi:MAG: hypothetical protein AAB805_00725 [Patescibacteria group bacterium]
MRILTSTRARKHISDLIDRVKYGGEVFGIGRRDSIDAILVPFPSVYRKDANDITNINAYSKSFDFLKNEPNLYSLKDAR